jgi:hypothetical protein
VRELLAAPDAGAGADATGLAEEVRPEVLRTVAPGECAERLARYVRRTLASVLGQRGGELAGDAEVSQLGFDSLMAMELRNRIEADTGVLVPVARLLASATPAAIAEELIALHQRAEPVTAATGTADERTEGEI